MNATTDRHRLFIIATCVALVLAAIGDAGPEIVESRSLVAGYDGPGPLIYLGFAVVVATVRWRYAPLLAVAMSVFFLVGGFSDTDFPSRLVTPTHAVEFVAAWLQTISFVATIVFGIAAVWWKAPADSLSGVRQSRRATPVAPAGDEVSTRKPLTMSTTATLPATAPRNTKLSLYGLAVGILGLVIAWIADPSKFPVFPPGIIFIAVCGALVAFGVRWWWSPIFAILIAVWIMIGGFLNGELTNNLASGNFGTITGNAVLYLGLVIAAITGVLAMIEGRRR